MDKSPNTEKPDSGGNRASTAGVSNTESPRLQECYAHALELMEQPGYDIDRAHDLLTECVIHDPGNLLYVNALLENLGRKHHDDKQSRQGHIYTAKGNLNKAISTRNWRHVLRLGPELLKHNPWDIAVLRAMARACEAERYSRAEVRYLQNALETAPEDAELNRRAAQLLVKLERFDEAIDCWRRVEDADPHDIEASRMIATLTLDKTRHQSSSEEGEEEVVEENKQSAEPVLSSATGDDGGEHHPPEEKKEPRKLVLTRRQELDQAIANSPENDEAYLQLAEYHLSEGRTYDAQRTLQKALSISKDPDVLNRVEDVNMLRAKEHAEIAEQRAAEEGTTEAREQAEKLREEQARLEFEIYKSRCERAPDDHSLQFELGVRLKRLGNFRESLDRLKAGLEVPEHRATASLEIGEILQRYQQFPKALQCYRQAAQLAAGEPSAADCRKRALYRAGALATTMKLTDSARQYLKELVTMDPEYLDAKPRLDKLAQMSENS